MTAANIMIRDVTTAPPSTTIDQARAQMDACFRHLPVVDAGAMVGNVSDRDVVRDQIQ